MTPRQKMFDHLIVTQREKEKFGETTKTEVGTVRFPNTGCVLLKPDLNPTEAKRTNC